MNITRVSEECQTKDEAYLEGYNQAIDDIKSKLEDFVSTNNYCLDSQYYNCNVGCDNCEAARVIDIYDLKEFIDSKLKGGTR